jgi:hypothetical protein
MATLTGRPSYVQRCAILIGGSVLLYLAAPRVNAGNIDLRNELNDGRRVGIVVAAVDVDTVDSVLMHALPS